MQTVITSAMVRDCLPSRPIDGHKGTFGRVLIVAGHYGMAGAAIFAARAALRSGVGLATVAVPRSIYPIVAAAVPEAVFLPLEETAEGTLTAAAMSTAVSHAAAADAVVIGPGLGQSEATRALVTAVIRQATGPVVLDADGINVIKPHILIEETGIAPLILTPHVGEMARLLGISIQAVQADREGIACRAARECRATVVLKGHHTLVVSPHEPSLRNDTGNDGMATGGSGDLLAGLIGGLAAQGIPPRDAAAAGVYLHGAAGDRAAARLSRRAMLPSDMIEELGALFLQFE